MLTTRTNWDTTEETFTLTMTRLGRGMSLLPEMEVNVMLFNQFLLRYSLHPVKTPVLSN